MRSSRILLKHLFQILIWVPLAQSLWFDEFFNSIETFNSTFSINPVDSDQYFYSFKPEVYQLNTWNKYVFTSLFDVDNLKINYTCNNPDTKLSIVAVSMTQHWPDTVYDICIDGHFNSEELKIGSIHSQLIIYFYPSDHGDLTWTSDVYIKIFSQGDTTPLKFLGGGFMSEEEDLDDEEEGDSSIFSILTSSFGVLYVGTGLWFLCFLKDSNKNCAMAIWCIYGVLYLSLISSVTLSLLSWAIFEFIMRFASSKETGGDSWITIQCIMKWLQLFS